MRVAILLAVLALPAAASSNSSRIGVRVAVLSTLRVSEQVGAPAKKSEAAGGALYVLPVNAQGAVVPSISVEGATLRASAGGEVRVFVPDGSEGRVMVTVLTDAAPPGVRRRR